MGLARASAADTIVIMSNVVLPVFAKGPIIRRKWAEQLAETTELEAGSVKLLQRMRAKYGAGPLMLRLPIRKQAVILSPSHVREVLARSPDPFATASSEKKAALSHFQPEGVLISDGPERTERRHFNEQVLGDDCPVHRLGDRFAQVVRAEMDELLARARAAGGFGWDDFSAAWFRIVRRVIFGDGARDDQEMRQLVDKLRYDANWAFMKPRRDRLYRLFQDRLKAHLGRAENGSLAGLIASMQAGDRTVPEQQVPQWLFAADPAGMATVRALALLAAHPEQEDRVMKDVVAAGAGEKRLPYLRAAMLEALRLWPTTPAILRQTTRPTRWENGTMPAGTGVLIYAPFFHRDDETLSYAHHFAPDIWMEDPPAGGWPLVPFSGGPGICPARNLVLLLGTLAIARLLERHRISISDPDRIDPSHLPATLDHHSLNFGVVPRP